MKTKFRIYASFQFLSVIALISFAITVVMVEHTASVEGLNFGSKDFWSQSVVDTLTFVRSEVSGIVASIFLYTTFVLTIITWVFGWLILRVKNRNLFDSLFLMFLMIPLIANMFAFFAQMTLKTKDYTSSTFDKKEIKEETEKIMKEDTTKK